MSEMEREDSDSPPPVRASARQVCVERRVWSGSVEEVWTEGVWQGCGILPDDAVARPPILTFPASSQVQRAQLQALKQAEEDARDLEEQKLVEARLNKMAEHRSVRPLPPVLFYTPLLHALACRP